MLLKNWLSALAACPVLLAGLPQIAKAHPHVWVSYETTVLQDNGAINGLAHVWTFDDMYTAMAVQGLDKNNDGKFDREELAELAKINMEGLKEFAYFTYARLGSEGLKFTDPADTWLEYKDNVLKLHFRLPLAQPVAAGAEGFSFSVYDPTWFIAFDPEKSNPIKVAAANAESCKVSMNDQSNEEASGDAQRLGDAFQTEFGGPSIGLGIAKTVSVKCNKA